MEEIVKKWYRYIFSDLKIKPLEDLALFGGMLWGGFWTMTMFHMFGPGWIQFCIAMIVAIILGGPVSMAYIRHLEKRIFEQLEKENEPTTTTTP